MRPSFYPRLVNGPFEDPGLYIPFYSENRAILFDLGDISTLSPRDCHKINHIFVSHTHIDHFIGKVTYLTDVGYTDSNIHRMIEFADQSDHLFIEAAFLDKHKDIALEKNHLTARQAGTIAGKAQVKRFTCFHLSPRYTDKEHLIFREAQDAYELAISRKRRIQ